MGEKVWGQGRDGVCSRTNMSNTCKPHPHTYPRYMWCLEKFPYRLYECTNYASVGRAPRHTVVVVCLCVCTVKAGVSVHPFINDTFRGVNLNHGF